MNFFLTKYSDFRGEASGFTADIMDDHSKDAINKDDDDDDEITKLLLQHEKKNSDSSKAAGGLTQGMNKLIMGVARTRKMYHFLS